MCNANNFISSVRVQTSGIRIRITGYSFRKSLETEKKISWNYFYIRGKRQHMFFCVNHLFQAIWSRRKIFINSFSNLVKCCSDSSEK